MIKKIFSFMSAGLAIWMMSGGGAITETSVNAQVTLKQEADYENNWILSGSGTYSETINLGEAMLVVDATKRLTSSSAQIVLTNDIIAGEYRQRDSYIGDDYASGQSGHVHFRGGMDATFTGLELGGHTNLSIGQNSSSTATVTVSGKTLIGSEMTSTLNVNAGSTFTANGEFQVNTTWRQGILQIRGTMNLNSSAEDSILLGYTSNIQYTSRVTVYDGGILNAPNSVVHCGYDGQLFFEIQNAGTANLYGLTFARNGDHQDSSYGSIQKTLTLKGGTLNLGEGGIYIREGKDSYPFQLVSGKIGTINGGNTTIADVELAIGGGDTVFQPASNATMTVRSNFTNSTWSDAGTGGIVQMNGAGTVDLAGNFNTTGGFQALAGTTIISGNFAGGKLAVDGGTVNITGNLSSSEGMTLTSGNVALSGSATGGDLVVNGGTLTVVRGQNGISSSNANLVANEGGSIVLTASSDSTNHVYFHNPITLNGGTLSTDDSLSGRWRRLSGKLTLNADATITCNSRLEFHGGMDGNGNVLTKNGSADLILHDMGMTGLKKIVSNSGLLCIESNSNQALITEEGVYMNGGTLQFWSQSNVSANVFFNGGRFQSSGGNPNSTSSEAVFTLQKDTQFENTAWSDAQAHFTMNGKLVADTGITLTKVGARQMTFAGNMDDFHGTIRVDSAETFLANGGNSADKPYDFNFQLNGGTFQINDSGTYYFQDVSNLIQFSSANSATFTLESGTLQNQGNSSITSSVVGASLTGTNGSLNLGSAGDTLNFEIADNASLTVSAAVRTQGGTFTKSGNGTLEISNLYVDSGTFNLSDSAISSVSEGIYIAPEAKLTWNSPIQLNDTALEMAGTFLVNLTGDSSSWEIDSLKLQGEIQISPDAVFELQADFSDLSWEPLLNDDTSLLLLQTDRDLSDTMFAVLADESLFGPGITFYALGDALGNVYLKTQVPEPSSWFLLLAGTLALVVTWRKRAPNASR